MLLIAGNHEDSRNYEKPTETRRKQSTRATVQRARDFSRSSPCCLTRRSRWSPVTAVPIVPIQVRREGASDTRNARDPIGQRVNPRTWQSDSRLSLDSIVAGILLAARRSVQQPFTRSRKNAGSFASSSGFSSSRENPLALFASHARNNV